MDITESNIHEKLENLAFSIFRDTNSYTFINESNLNDYITSKFQVILSYYLYDKASNIYKIRFIDSSFYQYFLAYYIYHNVENVREDKNILKVQSFLKSL